MSTPKKYNGSVGPAPKFGATTYVSRLDEVRERSKMVLDVLQRRSEHAENCVCNLCASARLLLWIAEQMRAES